MNSPRPARARKPEERGSRTPDSAAARIFKWIGYATAIISLILGVRQVSRIFSDRLETRHKVEALLATENLQLTAGDYRAAWHTLEDAAKVSADSPKIRAAQETLAMRWLENIRLSQGETFASITQMLDPVLARGVTSSHDPSRQADLTAHLGWSSFLQSREDKRAPDPAALYAKALEYDRNNPYAHAMWGHWILWSGGSLSQASPHFAAALASNRERDYVRSLQLSALLNRSQDNCQEEVIRTANAMRKANEAVPEQMKRSISNLYFSRMLPFSASTAKFVASVSPDEHLATFHWLFDGPLLNDADELSRTYYLGVLQESAGEKAEALSSYRSVLAQKGQREGVLFTAANAGIKRLSAAH